MMVANVANMDLNKPSKESQAKNLIMRAWRERWTDIQWGINVRSLVDQELDGSFIADCILQQALNGPGPNALVLSYLMHSIYSQMIRTSAVLRSVSQYDGYHKPFCIASLLDLLDNIKDQIILIQPDEADKCLELALSLEAIVHWLLTCMYSSLENLSDLSITDFPAEIEDSKIVIKCRKLLEYFLGDQFLNALVHVAIIEDANLYGNIQRMCKEVGKFSDGHHQEDIAEITKLIDKLSSFRDEDDASKYLRLLKVVDSKQMLVCNPSIQSVIMNSALLRTSKDIVTIAADLLIARQLKNLSTADLLCEVVHASMIGLADSIGKDQELKFIGFVFLQLPALLNILRERLGAGEDVVKGLDMFLHNESALDVIDAKLHCCTLDLFLNSLQKNGLINESDKKMLMKKKGPSSIPTKQNSSNAVLILKAESTLLSVLKTLDGDYVKNQDAILGVLCDMLGKSFELILTAASSTGRLQQVTSRLVKLNQCSRQVTGENTKASGTRAMIFDISFLMLCHTVQHYGSKSLASEEPDCFFEEWYRDCMVEDNTAKNPDIIINRCDQNKVDILLNQYLLGDELKTSLVFWHELCTNSVGVVRELLLAWENDAVSFPEVKKILDVFRSRICSLPVCIAAWLCAYIQMMPEEQCGKAKYILNHFLNPVPLDDSQDHFKERSLMMTSVITKMMNCIQPSTPSSIASGCISETKPVAELYKTCWKCMSSRGLIDNETTLTLKNLLGISGPHHFVQNVVKEMLDLQYNMELVHWSDLAYGIFHMDLNNCVAALVRGVLPSILHYSSSDVAFVEPQILALVSLAVDCILSFYLHTKSFVKEEPKDSNDGEPQNKRRRLAELPQSSKESLANLEHMLKELYEEFDKVLCQDGESQPQAVFVYHFLEQMSIKAPNLVLLHYLPNEIINQLMSLMCDDMTAKLLLALYNLGEKTGRQNCAQAICNLKFLQVVHRHQGRLNT